KVKIDFEENEIFIYREEEMKKRITDSSFSITSEVQKKFYHLECQSTVNGSMVVRMFEYDSQIALKHREEVGNVLNLKFPESAVLYLRHNKNTPDSLKVNIETPGGNVSYDIKTLKVKEYSLDEIFEKKLLFLIPFYIFTYEAELENINDSDEKIWKLICEYDDIVKRLEDLNSVGEIDTYEIISIKYITKKVVESLASKCEDVKKGVESVMGGKVLDYEAKRIRDAALEEGRMMAEEMLEEERLKAEEMLEEARTKDIVILVNVLRKYDATEEAIVNEIIETYKLSRKEAEGYLKG
ncbi:MAG: hypothetical protein IJA34_03245, partial [Lachnospiraceae bacterium]|nr:hypothetical protein [Lachnospiraceae bacterium]